MVTRTISTSNQGRTGKKIDNELNHNVSHIHIVNFINAEENTDERMKNTKQNKKQVMQTLILHKQVFFFRSTP